MSPQFIVQIVLIAVLLLAAFIIIVPGRGARGQAIRTLTIMLVALLGVVAVVFPELTTFVAGLVGVGRGVDLILYGLIVVFIGFAVASNIRARRSDRALTILARKFAILETRLAEGSPAGRASAPAEEAPEQSGGKPSEGSSASS